MLLPTDPELLGSGTGTPCFPLIIAAASRCIRILSVSIPHSRDQPRIWRTQNLWDIKELSWSEDTLWSEEDVFMTTTTKKQNSLLTT